MRTGSQHPKIGVAQRYMRHVMTLSLAVLVMTTLLVSSPAYAGGGAGGGGSGGGGGGGTWWSTSGWGWRLFPVSGSGPSGGIKNGSWPLAQATCSADSTNVVVFGVVGPNAGDSGFRGYEYHSVWYGPPTYQAYRGNNGLPWVTMAAAEAKFYSIDPASRAGLTWGGTGNGVAWMCWEDNPGWSTSGSTSINKTSMPPGQTATWTHTAKNDGPSKTTKKVTAVYARTGATANGTNAGVSSGGTVAWGSSSYTATAADAGKTICDHLTWTPTSSSSGGSESSGNKCVTVTYDYELMPSISTTQTSLTPGQPVNGVSATVNNTGQTATQGNSATAVVRFVVPKTGGVLTNTTGGTVTIANNSNYGCDVAKSVATGLTNCTDALQKNAGGQTFPKGITSILSNGADGGVAGLSLNVGDRVCYITVVNRYNESTSNILSWRFSAPKCIIIAKPAMVQVWGNDVRVGSAFAATTNTPFATSLVAKNSSIYGMSASYGGATRGSWGEYGVVAPIYTNPALSSVGMFGSAAGFMSAGASAGAPATWSHLTFSNTSVVQLGAFSQPAASGTIPGVSDYLQTVAAKAGLSVVSQSGNVSVGSYTPNQVLIVNGTVTITGNLSGPGSSANDKSLTQMVIIAKSIKINSNVSQVDAWLIASGAAPEGVIDTCADKAGSLTTGAGANSCDTVLTVNGPQMARYISNRRTGGANGDPAEIYNLRNDAYLWAYNVAQANNTLHTVYTQELPPRY